MYDLQKGYELAKELYAQYGVDVDKAMELCDSTPISIHCWQGDDVTGFEKNEGELTGGIQATGNYPGKATTPDELRQDMDFAFRFVPGKKKVNIHASYLESDTAVDRDAIKPEHFKNWADWAVEKGYGLDFNPTFFSHPKSENGTLSSADEDVRRFWIEHDKACREIGGYFARRTGQDCVINHWTPDGSKEIPVDTLGPRMRLKDSYDQIFAEKIPGTTVFIVAQRISSVENADKVLVLDNGRVSGFDTPANLLKTNAIYQDVYNSQTKGSGDFDEKGGEA